MKKSLLALLCIFALLEAKAQDSSWIYDFGTAPLTPYTSNIYSTTYLPAPLTGGGNAGVRASSGTEGAVELVSSNLSGGTGAELKMISGTTTTGAKFGLAPFTATSVATFQCNINISSGTNGRFLLYFGSGSNFTSGSGLSLPQTFAALRLSPTVTTVNLEWLSSATSPNYTTTGLSQTSLNKNQAYTLKFFMNNSNSESSYITGSGATTTNHNLPAGTFDIWIDNVKVLTNADPGTGLLSQGSNISGMNLLNVGAGSSAPVLYIDDISYSNFLTVTPPTPPAIVTNTLVNVDYESGTKNSGIPNLNTTNATAEDAEYLVSPGRTGNYAIAHRVTIGDQGYFSDNHWRSEAATAQMFDTGKYYPGDERRFEVSLQLKDWEPYTTGMAQNGDIIFQGKQSGGENPAWYLSAKRNSITFRIPNDNIEPSVIDDFRPYINQWIDFRIDAKMTTDATGYYKVYYRLPGQTEYTLAWEINNLRTFNQDVPEENPSGYLKWGLYRPGQSITTDPPNVATRIIYHDDIKIFELNNNSAPVQIWGNTFTGNNVDFSAPVITGNTTNPNIVNDGNTTPTFYYGTTGGLNTAGIISGRVLLNGWTNKIAASDPPTSINLNQYFEFTLQPSNGYEIDFSNLKFTARKGNTADPGTYVMRSSIDGFTSNITAPQTFTGTTATLLTYDLSSLSNIKTPVTFRLYWYGSNRTSGTPVVGIDDFSFNGQVKPVFYLPLKSDIIRNTNSGVCTYTAQTNEFDVIALNNCGVITYSYSLSGATTAAGSGSLANKVFNKGVTIVTWTATDGCNSSSNSYMVTINDTENPTVNSITSIALCHEDSGNYIIPSTTATDNCTISSMTYEITGATTRSGTGLDAGGNFNVGTSTITWKAIDNSGNSTTAVTSVTINPLISANIADVYAVNPGGNSNTIYLGYGPSSLTLTATPSNGTAPYTYLWNNGATSNNISVNPSTAGIHDYNVVITDALGCSISITKQIIVKDVRCADKKVTICHNNQSLCVSINAVSAHLAHGCYLGSCANTLGKNAMNTLVPEEEIIDFIAIAAPNPSKTEFQIIINGGDQNQAILITVFDILGRKISAIKSNYSACIVLGNTLNPGVYFVEIHNGANTKTIKLIKQ